MNDTSEVTIKDIKMSFGSMVLFMVKWAIASIPALIILSMLMGLITVLLGGILGGLMNF